MAEMWLNNEPCRAGNCKVRFGQGGQWDVNAQLNAAVHQHLSPETEISYIPYYSGEHIAGAHERWPGQCKKNFRGADANMHRSTGLHARKGRLQFQGLACELADDSPMLLLDAGHISFQQIFKAGKLDHGLAARFGHNIKRIYICDHPLLLKSNHMFP